MVKLNVYGDYTSNITGSDQVWAILSEIDFNKLVCLDIETEGLDRHRNAITSIQLGYFDKKGNVHIEFLVWNSFDEGVMKALMRALTKAKLLTHNGKFDFLFILQKTGIELPLWHDTLVMAHVTGHEELSLKALTKLYFGVDYDIEKEAKTGKVTPRLIKYGKQDIEFTMKLYQILRKQIKEKDVEYVYDHEMRVYKAYYKVEQTGVPLSPRRHEIKTQLQAEYKPYLDRLKEVADINWNSTDQVGLVLFSPEGTEIRKAPKKVTEWTVTNIKSGKSMVRKFRTKKEATELLIDRYGKPFLKDVSITKSTRIEEEFLGYGLGLECKQYTDGGKFAVGVEALSEYLSNPVVADLLQYKKLTKLETFINSWEDLQVEERIYPSFNITARTGRTTCSNPNL